MLTIKKSSKPNLKEKEVIRAWIKQ
jgi:hypothetical protein